MLFRMLEGWVVGGGGLGWGCEIVMPSARRAINGAQCSDGLNGNLVAASERFAVGRRKKNAANRHVGRL